MTKDSENQKASCMWCPSLLKNKNSLRRHIHEKHKEE